MTAIQKQKMLHSGKAKTVYSTNDPATLIMTFRDDISAFNGKKASQLLGKGALNNQFNAFIMEHLAQHGIPTHFKGIQHDAASCILPLTMFPIEFVVRNRAAGSLCKKFNIQAGLPLSPPIIEHYLKDDDLNDPMITMSHCESFNWIAKSHIEEANELSIQINTVLSKLFLQADLLLVDFKLEFGLFEEKLYLGDEFTPDGCRIWDQASLKKLDKDRFREGLGEVLSSYQIVAKRLGIPIK